MWSTSPDLSLSSAAHQLRAAQPAQTSRCPSLWRSGLWGSSVPGHLNCRELHLQVLQVLLQQCHSLAGGRVNHWTLKGLHPCRGVLRPQRGPHQEVPQGVDDLIKAGPDAGLMGPAALHELHQLPRCGAVPPGGPAQVRGYGGAPPLRQLHHDLRRQDALDTLLLLSAHSVQPAQHVVRLWACTPLPDDGAVASAHMLSSLVGVGALGLWGAGLGMAGQLCGCSDRALSDRQDCRWLCSSRHSISCLNSRREATRACAELKVACLGTVHSQPGAATLHLQAMISAGEPRVSPGSWSPLPMGSPRCTAPTE